MRLVGLIELADLDEFAEHYEERGRNGEIVIIDSSGEQPVGQA